MSRPSHEQDQALLRKVIHPRGIAQIAELRGGGIKRCQRSARHRFRIFREPTRDETAHSAERCGVRSEPSGEVTPRPCVQEIVGSRLLL
jgi:hypothetical protein